MASRNNRRSRNSAGFESLQTNNASGFTPAYTPGSQGRGANGAYRNQTGAGQYSRHSSNYSGRRRGSGKGKKIAIGVVCAVLVVAIGCGAAFAVWYNNISKELNQGDYTEEELSAINDQLVQTTSYTEPFYVLLVGSDKREDEEGQADADGARSDTNIVVRVDPVNNQATLVSIPRDTMVELDGYGTNKFNAAYNYGGVASTIREASQLTGVGISHYVEVGFNDLVNLVDAVGGVDVYVDELVDDPDADGTTDNPDWTHWVIQPGQQHLCGGEALTFARSRAYVDGDFTRTSNQRKVIEALVNKVMSLSVTEMPAVVQAAAKCVTTDMKITDILALAQQMKGNGSLTMYSAMLPSITGDINGISYVFCDEDATEKMMKIVDQGGDPSGITGSTSKMAQQYSGTSSSGSYSSSGTTSTSTGSTGTYSGNDLTRGSSSSGSTGSTYSGTSSTYYDSSGGYSSTYTYSDSSGTYSGTSTGYGYGY
jgi:polyisoprenyl-teichoic acid--peptidoglycan teichoic acid transferase